MLHKKQKSVKRIMTMLAVVAVVLFQMIGVEAKETQYRTEGGLVAYGSGAATLSIQAPDNQRLIGKQFRIHQLFEAENSVDLNSIDYTVNPTYRTALQTVVGARMNRGADAVTDYEIIDYMDQLNSAKVQGAQVELIPESVVGAYRYFVQELAAEIAKEEIEGFQVDVTSTKSNNTVQITGLPYGYFLMVDCTETEGQHAALSMPMLSTANPSASVYIKGFYPFLTEKIREDKDGIWCDIGDYEIGQDISYRYQSDVPDINGYQTYYYAWHTESDEALTLKENSIQIAIDGEVNNAPKTYILTSEEYKFIKDTSKSSFVLEVEDIKAIIDREFPNKSTKEENQYQQTVTVTYQAMLNDKAASATRPGFENKVRLEFSNNPNGSGDDETGFTPWDTVVCFTYKLLGKKVNNHGTELEGARFRLYHDEACTDEVFGAAATEYVSDANGNFTICGLDSDTYYLKEVEAPAGYRPLEKPVKIQIDAVFPEDRDHYVEGEGAEDGFLVLSATAHIKTFVDGKETEKNLELETDRQTGSVSMAIVNTVGRKLPVTGTFAIAILSMCGVGLIGAAMLRERKKHE